jgi:hypothetical protein
MPITGLARLPASPFPPTSCGQKASILCLDYFAANVEDFNLSYWDMLVLDPPEYRERSA